jgi:hypothetical protein
MRIRMPLRRIRLGRTKPISMHRTLAGMPELEHFESDEQRQRALREIEVEAGNPLTWDWAIGVGVLIAVVIVVTLTLRAFMHRMPIVGDFPRQVQEILRLAIILVVFFITLRLLHRWGAPEQLREKLIAAGVPVCRGCGYALKGLPADSSKCPECGRGFDEDVSKLIRPAPRTGEDAGRPPTPTEETRP